VSDVRLHRSLYDAGAIDAAIATYTSHAKIEKRDDGEHVVVSVTSERAGRAEKVALELGNYALGLTVQARKGEAASPAGGAR
jgi:hypothetical protein